MGYFKHLKIDKERYLKRDAECFPEPDKSFEGAPGFVVDEAHGVSVKDVDGTEYLDFGTPSAIIGHNHPLVVKAVQDQMKRIIHFTDAITEPHLQLAETLKQIAPGRLKDGKLILGCSGTDSVEFAVKLVKFHTQKSVIMCFVGGHHGRTPSTMPLTSDYSRSKLYQSPYVVESIYVPYPHCYRCILGQEYPDCDIACLNYIRQVLDQVVPPESVAAIMVEPLLSWSGFVRPPDGYIPNLKKLCEEYGILFVDDEVYTGSGRTGRMFAIEHSGVEPDIICLGKPMGAGFPIGATIARKEIIDGWATGKRFTSSSAGNLLASIASITVLRVIREEKLEQRAQRMGDFLMKGLKDRFTDSQFVGDIRGMGLLVSMEFVKDKNTKAPNPEEARRVYQGAFRKGIILNQITGTYHHIVRIVAPLIVTEEEITKLLDTLSEVV